MDGRNSPRSGGAILSLHQAEVAQTEPETKEELDAKDAKVRTWTTLITWLLLNLIWFGLSGVAAEHAVMSKSTGFVASHQFEAPNMLGLDRATPVTLTCDFEFINGTGEESVHLFLQSGDADAISIFDSNESAGCPATSFELNPGVHFILTQVRNGDDTVNRTPSKLIEGDVSLELDVYAPVVIEGFAIANVLGLLLFISERAIRDWAARKELRKMANLPLHKRRQKEVWEALNRDMSGGERAEVEDLAQFMNTDATAEKRRATMREAFAAQEEADGDTEEFVDDSALEEIDDELGKGSTEGLEGEVEEDPSLRTVRDIWDRLEDLD